MINKITKKKFYNIVDAVNCDIDSTNAFILSNERLTHDGRTGRFYTVFPSFTNFLENRASFQHCHEILVDHKNNKVNKGGRLVFDFDIKNKEIPITFKKDVELIINEVIDKYFIYVNKKILDFVWSTSENPKKFSKHLTVKNLYFEDWITMSKIFYRLFCKKWDKYNDWISSDDIIDSQIIRKNASLRMVGSSKINGYPLIFDEVHHRLTDSLIRIYFRKQRDEEQKITMANLKDGIKDKYLPEKKDKIFRNVSIEGSIESEDPTFPINIYNIAFKYVSEKCPGVFRIGKIFGSKVNLLRIKPAKCLLSNHIHEAENAYVNIKKNNGYYNFGFSCYRGKNCTPKLNYMNIGSIHVSEIEKVLLDLEKSKTFEMKSLV